MNETTWHQLCELNDFAGANTMARNIADRSILLYRSGREIFAVENRCTHLAMPLDEGRVIGGQIICPFHGACFNLRTGAAVSGPAVSPLVTHHVRIEDGRVYVELPVECDLAVSGKR